MGLVEVDVVGVKVVSVTCGTYLRRIAPEAMVVHGVKRLLG